MAVWMAPLQVLRTYISRSQGTSCLKRKCTHSFTHAHTHTPDRDVHTRPTAKYIDENWYERQIVGDAERLPEAMDNVNSTQSMKERQGARRQDGGDDRKKRWRYREENMMGEMRQRQQMDKHCKRAGGQTGHSLLSSSPTHVHTHSVDVYGATHNLQCRHFCSFTYKYVDILSVTRIDSC